jgi:hypothetical protein
MSPTDRAKLQVPEQPPVADAAGKDRFFSKVVG